MISSLLFLFSLVLVELFEVQMLLSFMQRYKAKITTSKITLTDVPVVQAFSLQGFTGLRNTPPPPSTVTDPNDPRVPKMLFIVSPSSSTNLIVTGVGMQYDLDIIFLYNNTVVDVAYLAKGTTYIPKSRVTHFLEIYHGIIPSNMMPVIGENVNITIYQ